jgi:hypothetical protein
MPSSVYMNVIKELVQAKASLKDRLIAVIGVGYLVVLILGAPLRMLKKTTNFSLPSERAVTFNLSIVQQQSCARCGLKASLRYVHFSLAGHRHIRPL